MISHTIRKNRKVHCRGGRENLETARILRFATIQPNFCQSGTAEYIQGKQGTLILGINLNSGCRNFNVKKTYYNYMEI